MGPILELLASNPISPPIMSRFKFCGEVLEEIIKEEPKEECSDIEQVKEEIKEELEIEDHLLKVEEDLALPQDEPLMPISLGQGHKSQFKKSDCDSETIWEKYLQHRQNSRWISCEKCDYKTELKSSLSRHTISKHLDEAEIKWFECEKCDYKAKHKRLLKLHVMGKHMDAESNRVDKSIKIVGSSVSKMKKNCCMYCKNFYAKLVPHLETAHKDEDDVKTLALFPKGNYDRKQLIEKLRKRGNFYSNTKTDTSELVVVRRRQESRENSASHYLPCTNCKGYYSVLSLRKHVRRCTLKKNKKKDVLRNGRAMEGQIHEIAGEKLRREVFPVLREDTVTKIVKFDKLIMIYGNKMCDHFQGSRHDAMIRARLRLLGRFLIEIKKIEPEIQDLTSVYQAKYYDKVIPAIQAVGGLFDGRFKSPATAFNLGIRLKSIGRILISEFSKAEDGVKKKQVEDFLKLMNEDISSSINKTVRRNNAKQKSSLLSSRTPEQL